ncbi:hypothetical protein HK097_010972 [Rhizophlyctis rosea]|uniref:Dynein regulatory complex protein 12 n=1 Tax=Rhizophlyctis rosea TaxID=64517 RepID=A0AAD5S6Y4_9FUNG|nr:hypothetical protein HK097_010972 [Rhizophlyctis rosea]
MPPKKKPGSAGSGKKKKAATKELTQDQLDATEKLVQAQAEIDTLLRELELRNDLNARLKLHIAEQKARILALEEQLDHRSQDRLELTSDMSRQYKTMQSEMLSRINMLEGQVTELKVKLARTETTMQKAAEDHTRVISEKDLIIEDQNVRMTYMSNEFESMLNETLAKMSKKLETVSLKWKESDNVHLSDVNQRRLADFHLTRLTLGKTDP